MRTYHPSAFCTTHGIFPATAISMGSGALLYIEGSNTNCPICGKMSEIFPGSYEVVKGRMNLLLSPSVTPEALAAIESVARRLQMNEITRAQAESEATKISPSFKGLFRGIKQETVATVAAAIITAIAAIGVARMSGSTSSTINNYYASPPAIADTVSSIPKYPRLPNAGPRPQVKPQALNRHERRKLEKNLR